MLKNSHIINSHFCFASENLFSALMSGKGTELSTETKELIITLSESVQTKAELSRMLNIPRTTITSVRQVTKDWHSGDFDAKRQLCQVHRHPRQELMASSCLVF